MAKTVEEIRPILAATRSQLFDKANVVATGIGYKVTDGRKTDEPAIICSVETKIPVNKLRARDRIATRIDGVPTDIIPTGPFSIFQDRKGQISNTQYRTGRFRPAPGGVSIGHIHITSGTLGCLVRKDDSLYILSNNHILANSNEATVGDPVLQPGPHDGGRQSEDEIAKLSDFVPIRFEEGDDSNGGCPIAGFFTTILNTLAALSGSKTRLRQYRIATENNKVDCAIAQPDMPDDVVADILEIGTINGITEGTLSMNIKKSGRTTGLTHGTIDQVDVTVRVNFGAGKTSVFEDQLMAGAMSQGGDSGSVILDTENNITGLLFAGSVTTTIINRIQHVFSELNVQLP